MSDELKLLIEQVRGYRMTPEEIREQAISFAYGNGHFEDPKLTREEIVRAAKLLYGDCDSSSAR